ncbi:MAG: DUF1800 domain-containing protein [Betaproteobacteria bacterium]
MASVASPATSAIDPVERYRWLNRLTWGANPAIADFARSVDRDTFVERQLQATGSHLPAPVQARIAALTISRVPIESLLRDLDERRKAADAVPGDEERKAAQQAHQQDVNRIAREPATRHVLRALYSTDQILERMTWFWLNHFSVNQNKANLRLIMGDYEESALRPHALGRFRDLLGAVASHPAMLRYLDNEQNAAGHINENFARELLELHTLGVDGGYSQQDVQELARILTGVGANFARTTPNVRKDLQSRYVRRGLFDFNPARHDFGDKRFLGEPIRGKGLEELDEALDRMASHPATGRLISLRLATYWLSDTPPPRLVDDMALTFRKTDGDIRATLRTLFLSPEFRSGIPPKFKDPMNYVISAVRLAYDTRPIVNVGPVLAWLNRMGEPLYGRATPDGYPLQGSAWMSPGQMTTRFEVAKAIGSSSAGLFRTEDPAPVDQPAFPQLANALYHEAIARTLSDSTRTALDQAGSQQEWNTLLLSSPEFMHR